MLNSIGDKIAPWGTPQFRGCLVAKGFTQKYGTDFTDTYAPVVNYTSIRTLLSIAASRGMAIEQVDVKS